MFNINRIWVSIDHRLRWLSLLSWCLEQLRKDFSRTHANDLEEKERAHAKELAAIRLQLDRALEITKIKVCFPRFSFTCDERSMRRNEKQISGLKI